MQVEKIARIVKEIASCFRASWLLKNDFKVAKKKMVALSFHIKTSDFIEICILLDINIQYSEDDFLNFTER